jgi:hypothetical protein
VKEPPPPPPTPAATGGDNEEVGPTDHDGRCIVEDAKAAVLLLYAPPSSVRWGPVVFKEAAVRGSGGTLAMVVASPDMEEGWCGRRVIDKKKTGGAVDYKTKVNDETVTEHCVCPAPHHGPHLPTVACDGCIEGCDGVGLNVENNKHAPRPALWKWFGAIRRSQYIWMMLSFASTVRGAPLDPPAPGLLHAGVCIVANCCKVKQQCREECRVGLFDMSGKARVLEHGCL